MYLIRFSKKSNNLEHYLSSRVQTRPNAKIKNSRYNLINFTHYNIVRIKQKKILFGVYGKPNNEYFEKGMLKIENSNTLIFKLICKLEKNGPRA